MFPLSLGFGLRRSHYHEILDHAGKLPHWEVITENLFAPTPADIQVLEMLRAESVVFLHGVALSIGSDAPLNWDYLKKVKSVYERWQPDLISDHLCWSSLGGQYFHDLYPLTYNQEGLLHVCERLQQVQDFFQKEICLENVSSYIEFKDSTLSEWDFISELVRRAGAKVLLDVNNVYVNSVNFNFDPKQFIESLPLGSVSQIHIAGAKTVDDFLLDDHGSPPSDEVIDLLKIALQRFGHKTPVIFEWDSQIPTFANLLVEGQKVREGVSL